MINFPGDLNTRLKEALIPTADDPEQPGLVVVDRFGNSISGGSGSSGGSSAGNSTWSNTSGDFTAVANAGTKTITLSGISSALSPTLSSLHFAAAIIKKISSDGTVTALPTSKISYSSGVLTLTDMTSNFISGDTVALFIPGPHKAYDATNDAIVFTELIPIEGTDTFTHVIGIQNKPVISALYSGYTFGANSDVDVSVVAAPSQLLSVWAGNKGSSLLYLQVHDKTSVPTSGNVPLLWKPLPAGSATVPGMTEINLSHLGPGGSYFTLGIAVGISSTPTTFTAHGTAADVFLGGVYK